MTGRLISIILIVVAFCAIGYLVFEKMRLERLNKELRQSAESCRKEVDAERAAWTKLYTACVEENNSLMTRMKEEHTRQNTLSK